MEQPITSRHHEILLCLSRLPRKMVKIHDRGNLCEFLLHELCSSSCFNLHKAAYFVDNPDFKCFHGVAGYDGSQAFDSSDIWSNPDEFSKFMACCSLHNRVKSIMHEDSFSSDSIGLLLRDISRSLGFNGCSHCSWDLKHDNCGILIYEKSDEHDCDVEEHLLDGISLLSFCPIH